MHVADVPSCAATLYTTSLAFDTLQSHEIRTVDLIRWKLFMSPFVSISITVCRNCWNHESPYEGQTVKPHSKVWVHLFSSVVQQKFFSHGCIRWGAGRSQCLVSCACTPSVGMALVQNCRDLSYLSILIVFLFGRICDKMTGGSCCRRPTTVTASQWHYMELREAHRIPSQQPLSHRCEHRHPARRSEDKEDKVNEDQPHSVQTHVKGLAHSVGSIAIALL